MDFEKKYSKMIKFKKNNENNKMNFLIIKYK